MFTIAMDALIVAIETQAEYLRTKKTWTRKIVLLTNGECPFDREYWERTVQKMDDYGVSLTVVSVLCFNFPNPMLTFTQRRRF
jgi:ATP-dependent DNA helicase 2 subunit 2